MRVFSDNAGGYTQCDRLDHDPLKGSSQTHGPLKSQYLKYFRHPDLCEERDTFLRDDLPKYNIQIKGTYRGDDIDVLYFEHDIAIGVICILVLMVAVLISVVWALKMNDITGAIALGGVIVTFVSFIASVYIRAACLAGITGHRH